MIHVTTCLCYSVLIEIIEIGKLRASALQESPEESVKKTDQSYHLPERRILSESIESLC